MSMSERIPHERGWAGDARRDAGDQADRDPLPTCEVPGAPAGGADEGQLDGARATDRVEGGEAAERAGTDRWLQASSGGRGDGMDATAGELDGGRRAGTVGGDAGPEPGHPLDERPGRGAGAARDGGPRPDPDRDRSDSEPAQELGVAAPRADRAAPPGAGGTDPRRDPLAGGGAPAAGVARGQPTGDGHRGDASRSGESRNRAVGQAVEECRPAGPGLPAGSSPSS